MTDATSLAGTGGSIPVGGAGAMLRAARQQQGLHIAALAASIKVAPAKLEALEAGRYHELPDLTFARALAKTVCRVLKIDPGPVLAQMPDTPDSGLARVDGGLNTPFRERPGRVDPTVWVPWRHPVLWAVALLLVAAAAFVLVPAVSVIGGASPFADTAPAPVMPPSEAAALPLATDGTAAAPPEAAEAASAVAGADGLAAVMSSTANATTIAAGNAGATDSSPAGAAPVAGGDALTLRAVQATWVQLSDGAGQTLMARLVPAGETVSLTAMPPLRLRIGNASGTELRFRGQLVDLKPVARDNIANITLP